MRLFRRLLTTVKEVYRQPIRGVDADYTERLHFSISVHFNNDNNAFVLWAKRRRVEKQHFTDQRGFCIEPVM